MAARSGFEWHCEHGFKVAALAAEADRARAQSLRENLDDLLALEPERWQRRRSAGASRRPSATSVDWSWKRPMGPAIRYGGFAWSVVTQLAEAAGL